MMAAPFKAVEHLLPPLLPSDPLAPGPFAFAVADRASANTVMGDLLADVEALLAARIGRLSLDDITRHAQTNPLDRPLGAHHHG